MPELTLGYAEQSTTIDGLVPWYGDAGNTFMFQFSADSGIISSVTINGQTPSDGVVTETTKGCVKVNPNLLADNAYHVITVKAENGEFTVVIKRGTPSDIPTPAVTTSQDGNITTTIPEGDITTPSEGEVTEPNIDSDITTPVIEETTKNTEDDVTTPAIEGDTTTPFVEPDTTTPVVTTPEVTTPEYVTPAVTTPEYTTPAVTTPQAGGNVTTGVGNTTTATPTTKASVVNVSVGKTKVKKVTKKLAAKKAKISLKSISGAKYQVKVSTVNSFKAKKTVTKNVTKATFTVNSSKIKGKKVLYVKARAYKVVNGTTYYGNWSKVKKVKIKK